jgi:hypothetical protein
MNHGMQHVQRTGTTLWPQDEYKLSWTENDPLHFVRVVHADAPLSGPDALTIPPTTYDDDKSTMPVVRAGGRTAGGNREVETHEAGANTLTTGHPDPRPVSPARSNISRCSHDEDWGEPPPPGAYYNDDNITSSYSLELEYLDNPTEPYTEPQRDKVGPVDIPTHSSPDQPPVHAAAATAAPADLPELTITHYDPVSHHYTVDNDDVCIDTPAQPPHGSHTNQQPGSCRDHGHVLCTVHCLATVVVRGSSPRDIVSANTAAEWFCFHCLRVGHWSCWCPTPHMNCHNTNCILPRWHPNFGDHCPVYNPYMSEKDRHHRHHQHTLARQTAEAAECTLTPKPPTLPPLPGAFPECRPTSPVQAGCAVDHDQTGSAYHCNWELARAYNPPCTRGDNWSQFSKRC